MDLLWVVYQARPTMPVSELPPLNSPIQIPALVTWPQAWGTIPPQLLFKSQLCRCQVSVTVSSTWLQHTAVYHVPKGLSTSPIYHHFLRKALLEVHQPSKRAGFKTKIAAIKIQIFPQGAPRLWKSRGQILTKGIVERLITGDEGRTRRNRLRMTVLSRRYKTENKTWIVWTHSCPTPGGLQQFWACMFFVCFFSHLTWIRSWASDLKVTSSNPRWGDSWS